MELNDQAPPHVQFACDLVGLAYEKYTLDEAINGVTLAAASFLLDLVVTEDQKVDEDLLHPIITHFKEALDKAISFAVDQIKSSAII